MSLTANQPTPNPLPRSALVTGAAGALGPALVRHLVEAGYAVRAVDLLDPTPGILPPGVEMRKGDICDSAFMTQAVQGMEVVFHLAAKLHVPNPGPELRPAYERVNVGGTRSVVEACRAANVRRLVFFSTISVYGPMRGAIADEDTLPRPDNLYAETKLAAEEIVLAAQTVPAGGPLGVVLRMAAIYGPRMKGNYPKLVKALERGWFVPVGNGSNRRTVIFEQDVLRAARLAAEHPQAAGKIFNASDGEIHPLRDITAAICAAMGRRPPRVCVPEGIAHVLSRAGDAVAGIAGRSLGLHAMVEKYVEDAAVSAERIRRELGFQPLFGLAEGWKRTLAAWRRDAPKQ